jgi:hypothetical protein
MPASRRDSGLIRCSSYRERGKQAAERRRLLASVRLRLPRPGTVKQGASPGSPEHGTDGRRRPHLNGVEYLKPVSFIERDILRVGRFEISTLLVAITWEQGVLHERRAIAFPLVERVDSNKR